MRVIRLMADYQCPPIWERVGDDLAPKDPASLPISAALAERIVAWSAEYGGTLNAADPASSGFPSDDAEIDWNKRGRGLWRELRAELGADFRVDYFDSEEQRILADPSSAST